MVATKELVALKDCILAKVSDAAHAGNIAALSALSAMATECERLIAETRDIDDHFSSLSALVETPPEGVPQHGAPPSVLPSRPRSNKRDGAQMRARWVADMKGKGVELQGYGKRYAASSGATVGLAPANELDGHPNKWWLGMADEPYDVAVLLCRSKSGRLYDIVLPVPTLGRCWDLLSRSGGQVQFNVRRDVGDFLLLVPWNEPLNVTQYLSNYEPLRGKGAA